MLLKSSNNPSSSNIINLQFHSQMVIVVEFNIQIQSQNTADQTDELERNHLHHHCCT